MILTLESESDKLNVEGEIIIQFAKAGMQMWREKAKINFTHLIERERQEIELLDYCTSTKIPHDDDTRIRLLLMLSCTSKLTMRTTLLVLKFSFQASRCDRPGKISFPILENKVSFSVDILPDYGPQIQFPNWSRTQTEADPNILLIGLDGVAEVEHEADQDHAHHVDGQGGHPEKDVAIENTDHLQEDDQRHKRKHLEAVIWFLCLVVVQGYDP